MSSKRDERTAEMINFPGQLAANGLGYASEAAARGDEFHLRDSAGGSTLAETIPVKKSGEESVAKSGYNEAENASPSTLTAFPDLYDLADPAGVTVSWDIREDTLANDWIGLYRKDDTDPGKWIDFRNRGVNGAKKGQVVWTFDNIASHFTSGETQVCFRYYYGKTGSLRATTQVVTVRRTAPQSGSALSAVSADEHASHEGSSSAAAEFVHFVIKDVSAVHLRKGMFFNPDPYIKLWLQPAVASAEAAAATGAGTSYRGHQQHTSVCENTTQPNWSQQVFAFRARLTDLLIMKLKDKFVSSRPTLNRFLGLVTVPVKTLLERGKSGLPLKFAVTGRTPNDDVSGYLYLALEVLKGATSSEPLGTYSLLESTDEGSSGSRRASLAGSSNRSDSSDDDEDGSAVAQAAMREAESASDVVNATSSHCSDARPPSGSSLLSRRSSSLSSSAEDLRPSHDEVNRIISSSSSVANSSLRSYAPAAAMVLHSDPQLHTPVALSAAASSDKEPDRGLLGMATGLGRDPVATSTDAKHVRRTLLSGSLSLAAVNPGKLTPALMRSSSPRPAGSAGADGLPAGWEARIDVHGRTFYIDHLNRKTTWIHPGMAPGGGSSSDVGSSGGGGTAVHRVPSLSHEQIRQLDQRYSIVRRLTMKGRGSPSASSSSVGAAEADAGAAAGTSPAGFPTTSLSPGAVDTVQGSQDTLEVPSSVSGKKPSSLPMPILIDGAVDRQRSPDESSLRQDEQATAEGASVHAELDYLRVPIVDSRPVTPVDDELLGYAERSLGSTSAAADSTGSAAAASSSSTGVGVELLAPGSAVATAAAVATGAASATSPMAGAVEWPPAVRLLLRDDFFSLVQYNDECQREFLRNVALKHMVHKIRKSPEAFAKYMHNRDLVAFLNKFAQHERELPSGWEMKLDKHRKPFFVDHTSRSTSYIDPRLPTDPPVVSLPVPLPLPHGRHRRGASMDDTRPNSRGSSPTSQYVTEKRNSNNSSPTTETAAAVTAAAPASTSTAAEAAAVHDSRQPSAAGDGNPNLVPLAYDAKVVAFLRQDGIMGVLQERSPALHKNDSLKRHLAAIVAEGAVALQRYRNNMDLTMLLSLFEQEIMAFVPTSLLARSDDSPDTAGISTVHASGKHHHMPTLKSDFQDKYRLFHQKLHSKGYGSGPGKIKMRLRRDHLLQDTYNRIMACSKRELQKCKLLISFEGEPGLDYGGPAREFFFLFSREIFNPYYGLFEYSANDMYTVQISPVSQFVDLASEWFRFAGRMLGLCMLHQYLMDCYFTRPFYKMLLKQSCDLTDLESLDAAFHQSLLWMRDNDITDSGLDLTFSVDEEVFGQVAEHELKPGGRSLAVTEKNKKEYIDRMVKWRIERGIAEQKESLLRGFHEVIDPKLVAIFDAKELELVIAGTADIDVADWRANTEYRSGYYDGHQVIVNYWRCIERFDNEQRLRLLQFVTGTSSIPFEGFVALRGSNGPRKFTIERWGDPESLPRAHTCFNRLDLPPYASLETMMDKLRVAIEETGTFGVE